MLLLVTSDFKKVAPHLQQSLYYGTIKFQIKSSTSQKTSDFENSYITCPSDGPMPQLTHGIVATLIFGYLLVAKVDNVEATLLKRYVFDVVAPTKI